MEEEEHKMYLYGLGYHIYSKNSASSVTFTRRLGWSDVGDWLSFGEDVYDWLSIGEDDIGGLDKGNAV